MKKTTSIHIKGINFIIEEEAYETLKNYMDRLSLKLAKTKGKEEIIEDIELRIAELFNASLTSTKGVIEQKDVDKTIETLGEPDQYIDEEDEDDKDASDSTQSKNTYGENRGESSQGEKKLYRDTENASIAGVCAGLAAYVTVDVVLVRVLFVILLISGGFGFPLYVILWVVLPSTNSHIDRLRMKGTPITVESVREEVELAAERLTRSSKKFQKEHGLGSALHKGASTLGRILSKAVGFFLLAFGLAASIFFVIVFVLKKGVVPVTDENGFLSPYQFGHLIFDTSQMNLLWWVGGSMLLIFILYLVASAMRFILNVRYPWHKYLSRFTVLAMVVTVIAGFYIGTTTMKNFSVNSDVRTKVGTTNDALEIKYITHFRQNQKDKNIRSRHMSEMSIRKGYIFHEGFQIHLRESMDSSFHVYQIKSASGTSTEESTQNAKHIRFKPVLKDHLLTVPNDYSYPRKDKIRAQQIRMVVEVPKGKTVQFEGESHNPEDDSYSIWIPSKNWDNEDWD